MNRRNFMGLAAVGASVAAARGAAEVAAEGPEGKPVLSFGLITDVQYADADPNGERHYRESVPKLKVAVDFLAKKTLPFTLHLGDLIDRDFKAFGTIMPLLAALGHPVYHLLGNHDYSVAEGEKCQVVSTLGMAHDYYTFRLAGVRFLMIDTNDLSTYKYPKDLPQNAESEMFLKKMAAEKAANAQAWNGGVSNTQLAWMDRELTAADAAKESVIVCGHHPLLPAEGHQAWDSEVVIALMDRHPSIIAYFCGHNHAGAEVVRNGIPFITFKSILHEPETNAYSVIHLFKDRLEIEGYGREKARTLSLKS